MKTTIVTIAAITAITMGIALADQHGYAQSGHDHGHHHAETEADAYAGQRAAAESVYAPAMEAMHKSMITNVSGDPDIDFVRGMIPHHQGAVDMARILKAKGKDPELQKLADEIIAAQEREIAFMQEWLKRKDR